MDPADPAHLLVTNGATVLLSVDGGCSWTATLEAANAPSLPGATAPPSVSHVAIADARHAYAVLLTSPASGRSAQVFFSGDGGASWQGGVGLPPIGAPLALTVAPSGPGTAYLALEDTALYVTTDGGASWARGAGLSGISLTDMTVDEQEPRSLWAWGGRGLYQSTDGGATLAKVGFDEGVVAADVAHPGGAPSAISVFLPNGSVHRSTDGGATYAILPPWLGVGWAVHDNTSPQRLVAVTRNAVVQYGAGRRAWDAVTPSFASEVADPRATRTSPGYVYVRTQAGLERMPVTDAAPRRAPASRLRPTAAPSIRPAVGEVRLAPGEQVTVRQTLHVPRLFAVEIFFLVDTTSSMEGLIAGLRHSMASIIETLTAANVDVRIGIAEFKDYPMDPFGIGGDVPYRLLRDLAPPDDELEVLLRSVQVGGGGDLPEAHLAGLLQAATGQGQGEPGADTFIEAGQAATFRDGVLRVIMLGSDAAFHDPDQDQGYPGPSFATVVGALRAKGINVVGLATSGPERRDLERLAVATGAVATGNVDCDGDGQADLGAGSALVCWVSQRGSGLASAVINQLDAIEARRRLDLAIDNPEGVVIGLNPPSFGVRNLGVDNDLPFEITYACKKQHVGRRFPIAITAVMDGRPVMQAFTTVACGPPIKVASSPPAPAGPATAPQSNPPTAVQPVPQPAVQATPQPAVQATPQPAMVSQPSEQQQLATVGQTGPVPGNEGSVELGFSPIRSAPSPSPVWPLAGGGLVASAAAVVRLRTRVVRAEARVRVATRRRP